MGCAVVYSGDDRMYNNLYAGSYAPAEGLTCGTHGYDRFTTPGEYREQLTAEGNTDEAKFYKVPQPVWAAGNAYAGYAKPFRAEKAPMLTAEIPLSVEQEDCSCVLEITLPEDAARWNCEPVSTERLGAPRITEEAFENPDGTPVDFDRDLLGEKRSRVVPGPLGSLNAGKQRIVVWHK